MKFPLSLYIGFRYTRAKRRNGFISFISLASMLGIALGVAVLITVLSVLNGFDYQIRAKFFSVLPEVSVMTRSDISSTWQNLGKQLQTQNSEITGYAPYSTGKGMVSFAGQVAGVAAMGIDPKQEITISQIDKKLVQGNLNTLTPKSFHMIIGKTLADNLGIGVGDKVTMFIPQATNSPVGILPRFKRFTVSGIFKVGNGIGYDDSLVYMNFKDTMTLFPGNSAMNGLHLKLHDIYEAPNLTEKLLGTLPVGYFVSNWTSDLGAFFHALAMEKTMMLVILVLIIAVAVFNLVSSLVMLVNDKQGDIAILRTLGASPGTIMRIFIVQGAVIGLVGIILGLIGGIILALNVTQLVNFLQHAFHVQFIQDSVYMLDYLPSRIQLGDIVEISFIAFIMALIATLYPAWRATKIQPADALRYE